MTTKGRIPDDVIALSRAMERDARAAAGDWISSLRRWDLYITLTYDQRRPDYVQAPSMWASKRHLEKWLGQVDKFFGRGVAAVSSLEYQGNGWPHWHGLVSAGGVSQLEFKTASKLWFDAYGYAKFSRVDLSDHAHISNYVAKYITKDSGDVVFYGPLEGLQQLPMKHML